MTTRTELKPITAEDVAELEAQGLHFEIVGGQMVLEAEEQALTSEEHGALEFAILLYLGNFVVQNKLGWLYPGDTTFVLDGEPDNIRLIRRPDVAFVRAERLKQTERDKYYYQAPDLAVEIISPSERVGDIQTKLNDYLAYGVQVVWQVYPEARQVIVYETDKPPMIYSLGQKIQGGALLPGFELLVDSIFERL